MRRSRRLATLAACGLLVGACAVSPASGGLESDGGVQDRQQPAGEPRHPGEHDSTRSAAAAAAFEACGRAAGWDFQDLDLNVSTSGQLIGIQYIAVKRSEDAPGENETVRRCLDEAGVDQP